MKILRFKDIKDRINASRSSIFRWEKAGEFPHRIQLSSRLIGWREADINDWINSRKKVEPRNQ